MDSLNQGICPVCARKCGKSAPRSAVMAHIRSSVDPEHMLWKEMNKLKRGPKKAVESSEEERIQSFIDAHREKIITLMQPVH